MTYQVPVKAFSITHTLVHISGVWHAQLLTSWCLKNRQFGLRAIFGAYWTQETFVSGVFAEKALRFPTAHVDRAFRPQFVTSLAIYE